MFLGKRRVIHPYLFQVLPEVKSLLHLCLSVKFGHITPQGFDPGHYLNPVGVTHCQIQRLGNMFLIFAEQKKFLGTLICREVSGVYMYVHVYCACNSMQLRWSGIS